MIGEKERTTEAELCYQGEVKPLLAPGGGDTATTLAGLAQRNPRSTGRSGRTEVASAEGNGVTLNRGLPDVQRKRSQMGGVLNSRLGKKLRR